MLKQDQYCKLNTESEQQSLLSKSQHVSVYFIILDNSAQTVIQSQGIIGSSSGKYLSSWSSQFKPSEQQNIGNSFNHWILESVSLEYLLFEMIKICISIKNNRYFIQAEELLSDFHWWVSGVFGGDDWDPRRLRPDKLLVRGNRHPSPREKSRVKWWKLKSGRKPMRWGV